MIKQCVVCGELQKEICVCKYCRSNVRDYAKGIFDYLYSSEEFGEYIYEVLIEETDDLLLQLDKEKREQKKKQKMLGDEFDLVEKARELCLGKEKKDV